MQGIFRPAGHVWLDLGSFCPKKHLYRFPDMVLGIFSSCNKIRDFEVVFPFSQELLSRASRERIF